MAAQLISSIAIDIGRRLLQSPQQYGNDMFENYTEVACSQEVYQCCHEDALAFYDNPNNTGECAPYNNEYVNPERLHWPLVLAAIVGALMAFGIGSNDSANSWGSTVGSGTIPVGVAVLIGGTMEWLGAISLGYGVSKKIRSGVASPDDPDCWACGYCHSEMAVYMVAMLSALFAAGVFLLLATFTSMPVSTTHAIVGGVVGATIAGVGGKCLNWSWPKGLSGIIVSWVLSPVISGCIGATTYIVLKVEILDRRNPRQMAFIFNPILYLITTFGVVMLVLLKSGPTKKLDHWKMVLISLGSGVGVALIGSGIIMPYLVVPNLPSKQPASEKEGVEMTPAQEKEPSKQECPAPSSGPISGPHSGPISQGLRLTFCREQEVLGEEYKHREEQLAEERKHQSPELQDAIYTFRPLLVFLAALESYAHGANDTANATSAVTGVWHTWESGLRDCSVGNTPVWLMAIAGGFVFLGVTTFGYRVIKTIGVNLVEIDSMRGYCIEFASTIAVVIANFINVPVSTTHCQVGAVIFVGALADGPRNVKWSLFGRIAATWVLTLPIAGLISAVLTLLFRLAVTN